MTKKAIEKPVPAAIPQARVSGRNLSPESSRAFIQERYREKLKQIPQAMVEHALWGGMKLLDLLEDGHVPRPETLPVLDQLMGHAFALAETTRGENAGGVFNLLIHLEEEAERQRDENVKIITKIWKEMQEAEKAAAILLDRVQTRWVEVFEGELNGEELLQNLTINVEILQKFLRLRIAKALDSLAGKEFETLEAKQETVAKINRLLAAADAQVECPKCNEPGLLRAQAVGRNKGGLFRVRHTNPVTDHASSTKFPALQLWTPKGN